MYEINKKKSDTSLVSVDAHMGAHMLPNHFTHSFFFSTLILSIQSSSGCEVMRENERFEDDEASPRLMSVAPPSATALSAVDSSEDKEE